jgi:hypothetical protein
MHKTIWIAGAILTASSTFATAADTTRQERMDAALSNYHANNPSASTSTTGISADSASSDCAIYSNGGTFSRAEAAAKRGACKTGHALDRGVKKTGNAIGNVGKKTGDAIRRTGEKMGGSPEKASSDPQPK